MSGIEFNKQTKEYRKPNLPIKELRYLPYFVKI